MRGLVLLSALIMSFNAMASWCDLKIARAVVREERKIGNRVSERQVDVKTVRRTSGSFATGQYEASVFETNSVYYVQTIETINGCKITKID